MNIFFAVVSGLFLLTISPPSFAGPFEECRTKHPEWYVCAADEDCVQIYNPCGWPDDTANKNFADDAETCNRHVGAALSCAAFDVAKEDPFSAKCIAGTCLAAEHR
jgi:hypothetical protein